MHKVLLLLLLLLQLMHWRKSLVVRKTEGKRHCVVVVGKS